ncbi:MAG: site-specific integrase [Gaiellaceae bacterium MAG52_C11]|nr:site-specific integrase [Candidatus Gaiellasilicea maunaloa]
MAQLAGIEVRHRTTCASHTGGKCNCKPAYQASVWSAREQKRLRKTFPTLAAARAWRAEAQTAIRRGTLRAPIAVTVRDAGVELVEGMHSGRVRTRSGDRYKPSAIRSYEAALRDRVVPVLGGKRLGDVQRRDVQKLADDLLAEGRDPSTIRNSLMPLRVIYRRAVEDGDLAVNPCTHLRLPAVRGRRERIAAPEEAQRLLAALPERDRPIWATALYAGLRRGELMALRWADVDLAAGVIRVERSYDDKGRVEIEPKSRAGRRTVPIVGALRDILVDRKAGHVGDGNLVFGTSGGTPFQPSNVWRRARTAWKRAELEPIGLHEARHTFASVLIAAGVNAKAITTYMGHASIQTTYDLYGKLMPGSESEATALVDAYLARADTANRLDQLGSSES